MDTFNTAFSVGGGALTWSGIVLAASILVAVVVSAIVVKKRGAYKDLALDACIIGIPAGLLGARLFSALSGKIAFSAFFDLGVIGLNLPGALLSIGVGIAVYARIKKFSVLEVFSLLAPGAFFGLAVGRWTDFFLCDGLGPTLGANVPKFFPLATFTAQYFSDGQTVAYAVFFLDFLVCLALGITSLLLQKRPRGTAARVTILLYLFAEFVLEWLRDGASRQIVFGEVRFNQIVLMAMLLFFVGVSLYAAKQKSSKADPAKADDWDEAKPAEADPAKADAGDEPTRAEADPAPMQDGEETNRAESDEAFEKMSEAGKSADAEIVKTEVDELDEAISADTLGTEPEKTPKREEERE